jgi:hypothetical protein
MFLLNPIIANLHNTKTGRFHPIVLEEKPLPGGGCPVRHKSKGHHTAGFDTRDEAIAECHEIADRIKGQLCIEKDFLWDGEVMPAMVVFFAEIEGVLQPAF